MFFYVYSKHTTTYEQQVYNLTSLYFSLLYNSEKNVTFSIQIFYIYEMLVFRTRLTPAL